MKAKGFFLFWMVEHAMLLEGKILSVKSFKSEKLQANKTVLADR